MREKTDRAVSLHRPVCTQVRNGLAAAPFRNLSQWILQLQEETKGEGGGEKKKDTVQNRRAVSQPSGHDRLSNDGGAPESKRDLPERRNSAQIHECRIGSEISEPKKKAEGKRAGKSTQEI